MYQLINVTEITIFPRRKNFMKKIISIILIFTVIMTMAGCRSDKESIDKTTTESVSKDDEILESVTSPTTEEETTEEAPIVNDLGGVDGTEVKMIAAIFEEAVKKLRKDGIVKSSDVCVSMKDTSILVDITFDDDDTDLELTMDKSTGIYTLTLDYDFTWLEGFSDTINGNDPAPYNEELLVTLLGIISSKPNEIFDRIDLDYHSAAGLSSTEWTEVGDCFIISSDVKVDEYISYKISTEPMD